MTSLSRAATQISIVSILELLKNISNAYRKVDLPESFLPTIVVKSLRYIVVDFLYNLKFFQRNLFKFHNRLLLITYFTLILAIFSRPISNLILKDFYTSSKLENLVNPFECFQLTV